MPLRINQLTDFCCQKIHLTNPLCTALGPQGESQHLVVDLLVYPNLFCNYFWFTIFWITSVLVAILSFPLVCLPLFCIV